ncbi:MAG: TIGR02206 family membrane protein [Saprospiraceae bacterium]|nr:TIGR02206 family membrane protein [Saprospiraceae bacterium]
MDAYFLDQRDFVNFGMEHLVLFTVYTLLCALILYGSRKYWSEVRQEKFIIGFLIVITSLQLVKPFIRLHYGMFDIRDDLPLHLCNMLPLMLLITLALKWRLGFAVLFFWVICGTSQSLFTPSVTERFPHYESIRYWTVHFGVIFAALYGLMVYRWKLNLGDVWRSWLWLNILALCMYFVNRVLESNYWYLMGKPTGPSVMDALRRWPYYLIELEAITLLAFLAVYGLTKLFTPEKRTKSSQI